MIIYETTKGQFVEDIECGLLIDKLEKNFQEKIGKTNTHELWSWQNSMQFMHMVMLDQSIPSDAGIALEYKLPTSSKRIDFLMSGRDENDHDSAIIIELKQWNSVEPVLDKDGVVRTILNGGLRETTHPSYQAWSYAKLISDYNAAVQEDQIHLHPCTYLHNYSLKDSDPLLNPHYQNYIKQAPVFSRHDLFKLREFIKKNIHFGDTRKVLYRIESGKLRPSQSLQDELLNMLKGNESFTLIDDQKVTYEAAKRLSIRSQIDDKKRVLVVKGGPGTGKSVIAINLLVSLLNQGLVAQYISKNAAPRNVYASKLKKSMKKSSIDHLFKGSGVYTSMEENTFDTLIVDEAHRLNEKSGLFGNLGENQMKEIIHSAKFSIFFIDEKQRIHIKDAGRIDTIKEFASIFDAEYSELTLNTQFRCDGSDDYLTWLDAVLDPTEIFTIPSSFDYDFQVYGSPTDLFEAIKAKNEIKNKSRLVAGYCWNWITKGKSDTKIHDIEIPKFEFSMSWNLANSTTWAIDPASIDQIGCIHTAQGLEFDYVGVIIGDDMRYENGRVITDFTKRARTDQSLKGIKKLHRQSPEKAQEIADEVIRNTYRTLMTRGQKGCYVFCVNKELNDYLKQKLSPASETHHETLYADTLVKIQGKVAEDKLDDN